LPRLTATGIIKQAIKEASSINPGIISLQIEEIMWEELSKTHAYVNNSLVFTRLARLGFNKFSDVKKMVKRLV